MKTRSDDGHGDASVRFGRKATAWLRRSIMAAIATPIPCEPDAFVVKGNDCTWERRALDDLLAWFLERPMRYVRWENAAVFRGSGFSDGGWEFVPDAVIADLNEAVAAVDRALDARDHPTLDDWLRADIAGDLWYAGAASGMTRAAPEIIARARAAAAARAWARTIACACGKQFTRDRRNARRCPDCRETARRVRAAAEQGRS